MYHTSWFQMNRISVDGTHRSCKDMDRLQHGPLKIQEPWVLITCIFLFYDMSISSHWKMEVWNMWQQKKTEHLFYGCTLQWALLILYPVSYPAYSKKVPFAALFISILGVGMHLWLSYNEHGKYCIQYPAYFKKVPLLLQLFRFFGIAVRGFHQCLDLPSSTPKSSSFSLSSQDVFSVLRYPSSFASRS